MHLTVRKMPWWEWALMLAGFTFLGWVSVTPAAQLDHTADFFYDELEWTKIVVPDSTFICHLKEGTDINCIELPIGTVIFLPVPANAPVDSLPRDDYNVPQERRF